VRDGSPDIEDSAERTGEGWELTGRKFWITNGAEAGLFIVFANADFAKGYKGITGFLVPVQSPEVLAERMVTLAQDPDLRVRFGLAGRRRAELQFNETYVASGFASTYRAMAGAPRNRNMRHALEVPATSKD